ncbi:hypothetical protein R3P38DRAFT_3263146 [Favolaschia claudopus]|uniref:Uncharacterized protein n=1 Tax=Favolaschia claudopus TaxID=2862362 RepID=A0AAW0CCG0_9AGAR
MAAFPAIPAILSTIPPLFVTNFPSVFLEQLTRQFLELDALPPSPSPPALPRRFSGFISTVVETTPNAPTARRCSRATAGVTKTQRATRVAATVMLNPPKHEHVLRKTTGCAWCSNADEAGDDVLVIDKVNKLAKLLLLVFYLRQLIGVSWPCPSAGSHLLHGPRSSTFSIYITAALLLCVVLSSSPSSPPTLALTLTQRRPQNDFLTTLLIVRPIR